MRVAYPNELYHYGILGMKWGIRRYQNPDGTLTEAGRKHYGSVENLESGRTRKQAEKYEKDKSVAIKSGKASKISKYSSNLSKEEMDEAIIHINFEQKLTDARLAETGQSAAKLKSVVDSGTKVKDALILTKDLYNLSAQTFNAFSPDKKLPIIGENKQTNPGVLKTLYELDKTKAKDARNAEFEKLLRTKDKDFFEKNSDKFSTDELKAVQERFDQKNSMFGGNKSSSSNSSGKTEAPSAKTETPRTEASSNDSWSSSSSYTNSGKSYENTTSSKVSSYNTNSSTYSSSSWNETPLSSIKWPSNSTISSSWKDTSVSSITNTDTSSAEAWLDSHMGMLGR